MLRRCFLSRALAIVSDDGYVRRFLLQSGPRHAIHCDLRELDLDLEPCVYGCGSGSCLVAAENLESYKRLFQ